MKKERTIKGAIIEIIVSLVVTMLMLIYIVAIINNFSNWTAKRQNLLPLPIFILICSFLGLLNGIITIPLVLKKKRNKALSEESKKRNNL